MSPWVCDSSETYQDDVTGWFNEYLGRAPKSNELQQYAGEMAAAKSYRDIDQDITNPHEYGQSLSAAAAGTAERLPDYFQPSVSTNSQQAAITAKDSVFTKLGA